MPDRGRSARGSLFFLSSSCGTADDPPAEINPVLA
jgi:hypothetical protein